MVIYIYPFIFKVFIEVCTYEQGTIEQAFFPVEKLDIKDRDIDGILKRDINSIDVTKAVN